jgi:hypothetical protein
MIKKPLRALQALLDKWHKLSPGERLRYQITALFLMFAIYGLILYPISHGRLVESKKMLSRRLDRIKKRGGGDEKAEAGPNPRMLAGKLAKVEAQLKGNATVYGALDVGFAPLESGAERQQLMLEISRLAERSGLQLQSVSRKGAGGPKEMTITAEDPVLGRPLLIVTGQARFEQLLNFLDGLKRLPYQVSVMNLKLKLKLKLKLDPLKSLRPGGRASDGNLNIALEVSI